MARQFVELLGFAGALAMAAGCSSRATGSDASVDAGAHEATVTLASCDRVQAMSVCAEYDEAGLRQGARVLEAQCTRLRGTFALAACPNTAVVAACVLATGERRKLYGSGGAPYDAARARSECDSYHGRFEAIP